MDILNSSTFFLPYFWGVTDDGSVLFLFLRLLAMMRSIIVELLSYYHLCANIMYIFPVCFCLRLDYRGILNDIIVCAMIAVTVASV